MHSKIPHYLTDKSSPFDSSSRSPDKIKITAISKTCLCISTVLYHYFLLQNKQTCFDNKVFLFQRMFSGKFKSKLNLQYHYIFYIFQCMSPPSKFRTALQRINLDLYTDQNFNSHVVGGKKYFITI